MDEAEKIQELLIGQAEIKQQLGRIISDIESEKDIRKRRNDDIDKRLRIIEDWKNNLQGRIMVAVIVGGCIWSVIMAIIIWAINKNK